MTLFELVAKLVLDSGGFESGIQSAKETASKFGEGFAKIGKLAGVAFGAAEAAVGAFAASSIATGQKFDSAMSQVAATMGTTVDQIEDMREFAQKMGRETAFSASEAADAMNILAMAGYSAKENMETLPAILDMASAGGLGIAEAADYATGIIAGFSNETLEASTIADKLAKVASSAKGDVASFGEGLSTVAGMANTTGQKMQDMTVALGILGNNNFAASEAGNALSRTLKNLYQPTDSAAKIMKELGLSAYDAQGNARPLQDVLGDLNVALDGMSDQAKNQYLSQIFDAATLKSVPALLNSVAISTDDVSAALAQAGISWDKYKDSYWYATNGTEGLLDELIYNIQTLGSSNEDMLAYLRSEYGMTAEDAQRAIDAVTQSINSQQSAWDTLATEIKGSWYSIDSLTEKISDAGGSIDGMRAAMESIGVTNAEFDTALKLSEGSAHAFAEALLESADEGTEIETVMNSLGMRLADVQYAFNETAGAASAMAATQLDNLQGDLTLFNSALEGAQIAVSDKLTPSLREFVQFGSEAISKMTAAFQTDGLEGLIDSFGEQLGKGLSMIFDMIPTFASAGTQLMVAFGKAILNSIPAIATALSSMLDMAVDAILKGLPEFTKSAVTLMLSFGNNMISEIPKIASKILPAIANVAQSIRANAGVMMNAGVELVNRLMSGFENTIPELINYAPTIVESLIGTLTDNIPKFVDIGTSYIRTIASGVAQAIPTLIQTALPLVADFAKNLRSSVGNFASAGYEMMRNVIKGIKDSIPAVLENVPIIIEQFLGTFLDNIPELVLIGAEFLSTIANGVREAIPTLLETVLPMLVDFTGTMADNIGTLVDAGIELVIGIVQGIMEGLPTLIANVPQIITNICRVINDNMPKILMAGISILWEIVKGLINAIPALLSNMGNIMLMVINVVEAIDWLGLGKNILTFIKNGVEKIGEELPKTLKKFAQDAWDWVKNIDWLGLGSNIINGIVSGIKNIGSSLAGAVVGKAKDAFNAAKSFFRVGSPSKLMRDEIGRWIPEGLAVGITANADSVTDAMNELSEMTVDAYNPHFKPVTTPKERESTALLNAIVDLKDSILGMGITLDSGVLVGELTPAIDTTLGAYTIRKNRGN